MGAANRKAIERPPAELPGAELFGPVLVESAKKSPGMRQAVAEARREVAQSLPLVVRTLAREAVEGSVTHLKLFLELSGVLKGGLAAPEKAVREPTLYEVLQEKWEQDAALRASEKSADRAKAEEVLSGI